jgi:hypothetical protein
MTKKAKKPAKPAPKKAKAKPAKPAPKKAKAKSTKAKAKAKEKDKVTAAALLAAMPTPALDAISDGFKTGASLDAISDRLETMQKQQLGALDAISAESSRRQALEGKGASLSDEKLRQALEAGKMSASHLLLGGAVSQLLSQLVGSKPASSEPQENGDLGELVIHATESLDSLLTRLRIDKTATDAELLDASVCLKDMAVTVRTAFSLVSEALTKKLRMSEFAPDRRPRGRRISDVAEAKKRIEALAAQKGNVFEQAQKDGGAFAQAITPAVQFSEVEQGGDAVYLALQALATEGKVTIHRVKGSMPRYMWSGGSSCTA